MADTLVDGVKTEAPPKSIAKKPKRRRARLIALIVMLPLLVGGYFLWRDFCSYESTDDAQIDRPIHAISARISGYVDQVLGEEQQIVKARDAPGILDPPDHYLAAA